MEVISEIQKKYLKKDIPKFDVGDKVKVFVKIKEADKERVQGFEGIVIRRQEGGIGTNFTVRKIVDGIGVERTFMLHSPKIEKILVLKKGKVKRAKLYYLRERTGIKATKIKEEEGAQE